MGVWAQLWPNLVANALWVPIAAVWAWAHRRWSKRYLAMFHDHVTSLHERIEHLTGMKRDDE